MGFQIAIPLEYDWAQDLDQALLHKISHTNFEFKVSRKANGSLNRILSNLPIVENLRIISLLTEQPDFPMRHCYFDFKNLANLKKVYVFFSYNKTRGDDNRKYDHVVLD